MSDTLLARRPDREQESQVEKNYEQHVDRHVTGKAGNPERQELRHPGLEDEIGQNEQHEPRNQGDATSCGQRSTPF